MSMAAARIGIAVLGSTGSIGVSTLDVVARHPDRFRVVALAAQSNVERMYQQCLDHQPAFVVLTDASAPTPPASLPPLRWQPSRN